VQPERIASRLDEGFADATVMAEYLVIRGVPFRTAHHIVGSLVALCDQKGVAQLSELSLEELREKSKAIEKDVYGILGAARVIQNYRSAGAGGVKQLAAQLKRWKKILA
jgi:argininosuccinate lyase